MIKCNDDIQIVYKWYINGNNVSVREPDLCGAEELWSCGVWRGSVGINHI